MQSRMRFQVWKSLDAVKQRFRKANTGKCQCWVTVWVGGSVNIKGKSIRAGKITHLPRLSSSDDASSDDATHPKKVLSGRSLAHKLTSP